MNGHPTAAMWATLIVMTSNALAVPATSTRQPSVRFDTRKNVVILQAPVFVPEQSRTLPIGTVPFLSATTYLRRPSEGLSRRRPDDAFDGAAVMLGNPQALTANTKRCSILCEFGMESDVEGVQMCKCRDPCKEILCINGKKCVPEKACNGLACKYRATCKVETVCTLGKPRYDITTCSNGSRRYYYDSARGMCRKFRGCGEVSGNSFVTKRSCSQTCEGAAAQRETASAANPIAVGTAPKAASVEMERSSSSRIHLSDACPTNLPYTKCPYDPCGGCKSPDVVCRPSFCGKCRAVYISLRTGRVTESDGGLC